MSHVILFNSVGVVLIILIITWFWLMKDKLVEADASEIRITVKEGAYSPRRIATTRTELTLNFIREDHSPCSEYVLFDQLNIREQLPLNKTHKIILKNLKPGRYRFTCQMGMYQGELIIK